MIIAVLLTASIAIGADPFDPAEHLGFWIDEGTITPANVVVLPLDQRFLQDDELPLDHMGPVGSLAIRGRLALKNARAHARITLLDTTLKEYLVGEFYVLMTGENEFDLAGICRETCLLPKVMPHRLNITIRDAILEIEALEFIAASPPPVDLADRRERIRAAQSTAIIDRINAQIDRYGLDWTAGETGYSALSYQDLKSRTNTRPIPVLHGLEYYVSGVYSEPEELGDNGGGADPGFDTSGGAQVMPRFDWRDRHNANDPESPYFDGDASGSGWMTPVTLQACSDCWAHTVAGVMEAQINLSLNRHRDVDLSEQHLLSCSGAGDCDGGSIIETLDFAIESEIVPESCFPYLGVDPDQSNDANCAKCCAKPEYTAYIDDKKEIYNQLRHDPAETTLRIKRALIKYGPLTSKWALKWHYMVLVGFETDITDHQTVWIYKNSWGASWGENGYLRIKHPVAQLRPTYAIIGVHLVTAGVESSPACRDADNDGYFAWGLGRPRPAGCAVVGAEQDCNDADAALGPANARGACTRLDLDRVSGDEDEDDTKSGVTLSSGGGAGGGGGSVDWTSCALLLTLFAARRRPARQGNREPGLRS